MTQPLDVEYVELRARGEDDAAREIVKALKKISTEIKKAALQIEQSMKASFEKVEDEAKDAGTKVAADIIAGAKIAKNAVDDLADEATRDLRRIQREAAETGAALAASMAAGQAVGRVRVPVGGDVDVDRSNLLIRSLSGVGSVIRSGLSGLVGILGAVRGLFVKIGEDGTRSLTRLGESISQLTGLLGRLGGAMGSFAASNPLLVLILALLPAIFAVIGALGQLWGLLLLLPGTIGGLIAVIAPLIIAFQGFGEAVSAVASGDLEKINEALKGMPPAMQTVVREVAGLKDEFNLLKRTVQQNFFAPLQGAFREIGEYLLPVVRRGLGRVAGALGRFADAFLDLLVANDILDAIGDLFASVARSLNRIRPQTIRLIGVLFGVMEHSLPFLERIGMAIGRMFDKISDFLSEAMRTGEFNDFLEDAFRITRELIDLFIAFGKYLKTIFGAGADEGESFIVKLTEIFNKMNEFFQSEEGQKALDLFYEGVILLIEVLELLVPVMQTVAKFMSVIHDAFSEMPGAVNEAGNSIQGFFGKIGEFFSRIGQWFMELPGRIVSFIQMLPDLLDQIFTDMMERAGYAVGFGLGLIVFAFTELPGRVVSAVISIIERVTTIFVQMTQGAVSQAQQLVERVVGWLSKLPGRAVNAIQSAPGRIIKVLQSIIPRAYRIGQDIVRGIADGIASMVSWAIGKARSFADGIVDGFKGALGIGSPSKRMAEEVGRPMSQGIGVGVESESNSLLRMIGSVTTGVLAAARGVSTQAASSSDSSVVFEQGSVVVSFQGAVPTQREAFETGRAVGQGILQTLSRRSVRTAVRMA
jgi:phage-related protein